MIGRMAGIDEDESPEEEGSINPCTEVTVTLSAGAAAASMWACSFARDFAEDASHYAVGMQTISSGVGALEEKLIEKLKESFPEEDYIVPFDAQSPISYNFHLHEASMLCGALSFVVENSNMFFTHAGIDNEDREDMVTAFKLGISETSMSVQQTLQLLTVGSTRSKEMQH